MGYAHDIYLHKDFDREAFAAASDDIRRLLGRMEIAVAGPTGRPGTMPIIEHDYIAFNGVNHACVCDPEDPAYHTDAICAPACYRWRIDTRMPFDVDARADVPLSSLHEDHHWFYCKTRRLPYDRAVMVAMLALKHHLGDSAIMRSHGSWRGVWQRAVRDYTHVFPERAPVENILDGDESAELVPETAAVDVASGLDARVFPERAPVQNVPDGDEGAELVPENAAVDVVSNLAEILARTQRLEASVKALSDLLACEAPQRDGVVRRPRRRGSAERLIIAHGTPMT